MSLSKNLIVLLIACCVPGAVPRHGCAQDTLVVRAENPPAWGEAPRLVEELRLGTIMGKETWVFGNLKGVAVSRDGMIWVADRTSNSIKRFSPEGQYLGEVGGHGQGPGEFTYLLGLTEMPDGRMAAWDMMSSSVTVFMPDGSYSASFRVPEGLTGGLKPPILADDSSGFYIRVVVPPRAALHDPGPEPGPALRSGQGWLRVSEDGEVLDTIAIPSEERRGPAGAQSYLFESMPTYPVRTLSFLTRDGTQITGRTDEYTFFRPLEDGRIVRIERSWEAVPVKRKERETFRALAEHQAARAGRAVERIQGEKPPWWALWVDEETRIWVARHSPGFRRPETAMEREARARFDNPPREWWEPLVLDVIEADGRFLGTLRFPNVQTDLAVARGMHVWVIEAGEYDEKYVVRYRIEPA